ncbi:hemolysin type calcium-binding protein [Enterovirga rhinocerotis]|uniref:Hemolysin type calcium-binding protein n=2 Tax=Enterovirga rhinocerotis TaxID=1339210 RepID=A0A4R7CA58_9HYPH|nr:hemolysin type calcium-binding protein [Enterovirga rhinocerotis]
MPTNYSFIYVGPYKYSPSFSSGTPVDVLRLTVFHTGYNGNDGTNIYAPSTASYGFFINLSDSIVSTRLIGGAYADILRGGIEDDVLEGGAGGDTLEGGDGIDTVSYEHASGGVVVFLDPSMWSGMSGDAAGDTFSSIENVRGSAFDDVLVGDGAANLLEGGGGDDRLDGGLGADTMYGGVGNDIYYVDDDGDVVVELAGEGIDQVRTTLDNYVLGDNVENLFLMGSADLSGTGNELDNILMGNSGANTLSGGAGDDRLDGRAGADTLVGGTGDDTYYVDDLGDGIVEAVGEGYDTAMLSVEGYVLADGVSIERLILRDGIVSASGNDLDNVIQGNAGDNVLSGGAGRDTLRGLAGDDVLIGGEGIDSLFGGAGADTFELTATTADRDMIRDFVAGEDTLQISASLFGGGLIAGDELTPEQFVLSTTGRATSATDRFLYVESKGHLYYDADGSGRDEAPQLIAVLTTNPALTSAHFDIVI